MKEKEILGEGYRDSDKEDNYKKIERKKDRIGLRHRHRIE